MKFWCAVISKFSWKWFALEFKWHHTRTPVTHIHTHLRAHSDILRVCVCINIQKDFACGAHFEYIWQFLQRSPPSASLFFCLIVREMRNICIYLSSRKTAECRNVISMKAEQSTDPELKSCAGSHSRAHPKVAASAQAHAQAGAEAETENLWSSLLFFLWIPCMAVKRQA